MIILPFNFPRIFLNFAFLRNSSSFAHYVPAGVDPAENFWGVVTDERSESLARKVRVPRSALSARPPASEASPSRRPSRARGAKRHERVWQGLNFG